MRFRAGGLAFTASVTEVHEEPSPQTGAGQSDGQESTSSPWLASQEPEPVPQVQPPPATSLRMAPLSTMKKTSSVR